MKLVSQSLVGRVVGPSSGSTPDAMLLDHIASFLGHVGEGKWPGDETKKIPYNMMLPRRS